MGKRGRKTGRAVHRPLQKYLRLLKNEHEYVDSFEYNFGIYSYKVKDISNALKWLLRSFQTRANSSNESFIDIETQLVSLRLTSICLLSLQQFEKFYDMMKQAQNLKFDSAGIYLILKVGLIIQKPNIDAFLVTNLQSDNMDFVLYRWTLICITCIQLFTDAYKLNEVTVA